ncbi:uncharacterized protein L201_000015 [Kwoniella dendrophila CBS 6074]|uniref:RNI-like protein n=1 Tax=Kwoniella dendrophila CBS 6074 TaxID=1295534 RepID=A0AAX4JJQ8_9TREE
MSESAPVDGLDLMVTSEQDVKKDAGVSVPVESATENTTQMSKETELPLTTSDKNQITPESDTVNTPAIEPSSSVLSTHPPAPSSLPANTLQPPSATAPTPSPAKRRPKPPTKGILKPPPAPAKPTLGNRLRDIVGGAVNTAVGTTTRLFDQNEESGIAGPSSPSGLNGQPSSSGLQPTNSAPGGTLASISGRLAGLGLSRFVVNATGQGGLPSNNTTPTGSPFPSRSISLPETGSPMIIANGPNGNIVMTEKSRQKQPLKRATFVLPSLSITYPISSQGEPWSTKVIEDRKRIESNHKLLLSSSCGPQYWTSQRLVTLYESACRGREERPRVGIVRALETIPSPPKLRYIHLTLRPVDHTTIGIALPPGSPNNLDVPFTRYSAESFSDVLSAEWGLMELRLENGVLETEDSMKPILHSLLISGTLPSLSLSGNKKIKAGGWRLLAVFLKRARSLRYIDLSDTTWDKKGIEYLVQALTSSRIKPLESTPNLGASPDPSTQPEGQDKLENGLDDAQQESNESEKISINAYGSFIPPAPLLKENDENRTPAAVQTLRLDGCALRANVMETLAQGVRTSDLKNISLRRNRIGPLGAVALALMIRDYPDSAMTMSALSPGLSTTSTTQSPLLPSENTASPNPSTSTPLPYAARTRKPQPDLPNDERDLPPIPLVVSSATGGITSRTVPEGYKPPPPPKHPLVMPGGGNSAMQDSGNFTVTQTTAEGKMSSAELGGASMALQRSVRALDGVERIGRLLTLDLKSNEIKNGVNYIAQVLKRNRTLKVLNLSDNKIETSGLVALAEALKYNSTLETLDLSSNPCCGPNGEGIAALRTAFTVNNSLKRLFLSDTGLTTDGAISLAEFLPETKSLLHLDLTNNPNIDTAGVLAISVGLKSNKLIRCLDISIQPNQPDLAELSQSILQSCIRNTEIAVSSTKSSHGQEIIWGPIKKSTLVKQVKEITELKKEKERFDLSQSPQGQAREYVYTLKPERVLSISEETLRDLQRWFEASKIYQKSKVSNSDVNWEPNTLLPKEDFSVLHERSKVLKERLIEQIQDPKTNPGSLESLLFLNDQLTNFIDAGKSFKPPPRLLLPSQIVTTSYDSSSASSLTSSQQNQRLPSSSSSPANSSNGRLHQNQYQQRRHMRISSTEISSPNFSIGDSDNDSDPEEIDEKSFTQSTPTKSSTLASTITPKSNTSSKTYQNSGLGLDSMRIPSSMKEGLLEKQENEASPSTGLLPVRRGASEGDDDDLLNDLTSPTEKTSKAWVEEEGEIFRKGNKLGVIDDEDDTLGEEKDQVSGEELRKEILETPVARSPTRRVIPLEGEEEGDNVEEVGKGLISINND